MTTLMVSMAFDPARLSEVREHVASDVTAWASRQPGFVSGRWCQSTDGTHGFGLVEFANADTAQAAASGPRGNHPDPVRAWNITAVDLLETIAQV